MALIERYRELGIASILAHRATIDPQRPFLLHDTRRVTFGELDSEAEALAAAFHNLGIEAGDRIALILPFCPEFVASMLAAAKLGATIVPLDPLLTPSELHYMLRHSEAVAAVTIETFHGIQYLEMFEDILVQLPELKYLVTVGEEELWYDDRIFQYEDMVSAGKGRDYPPRANVSNTDVFALLYTSGTTGKPKGVMVTDQNLVVASGGTVERLGLTRDDRVAGVASLAHVFGLGPGVVGSLVAGSSLILASDLDAERALDLIEAHRVTVEYATPTLLAMQVRGQVERPRDLTSLRAIMVGGGPVREELAAEAEELMGASVLLAYSLTEAGSTVTCGQVDDSSVRRHFTVGRPVEGVEIRILDEGQVLPVESVGEVAVRGSTLMKAYYRQPKETAGRVGPDGFFLTGDLGMVDEEGYLHLVGRRYDVIIHTGSNVYPREVEDRLHAHPAVQEAVVVGIPDDVLGEATCACLVLEEGAMVNVTEIRDWCRASLAEQKVPDLVRFLDSLERSASGEIRRAEVRRAILADD